MRLLTGYAPPLIWGPEIEVGAHIGVAQFEINYEAVGDTLVMGRVRYFSENGGVEKTVEFKDTIGITTSNSVANVYCQFKGVVLGSAVKITVNP